MKAFSKFVLNFGTQGKSIEFKNRYQVSPMSSYMSLEKDGTLNGYHYARYGQQVFGGFGSVVVEATGVSAQGRLTPQCLGLWNDKQEEGFKDFIKKMKIGMPDVKIGIELVHAGRKAASYTPREGGRQLEKDSKDFWMPVAPTAIPFHPSQVTPHELTEKEIKEIEKQFVESAIRAKRAGFDFVMLHGGNGYLVPNFFLPKANKRTDKYGGSFENRIRFFVEITEGVIEAIGEDIPVTARVTWEETPYENPKNDKEIEKLNKERWQMDDFLALTKKLTSLGVCMIDVTAGGNSIGEPHTGMFVPKYHWPAAKKVKEEFKVPVLSTSIHQSAEDVEEALEFGNDLVSIGRGALAMPYMPLYHHHKLGGKDTFKLYQNGDQWGFFGGSFKFNY